MYKELHNVNFQHKPEFYTDHINSAPALMHTQQMEFRLHKFRKARGMTQVQVAEALGISPGLYNQLESGKRRMNETYLAALAKLYGVSPVELIVDEVRADPLFAELDAAWRRLTPAERRILVISAKGIAESHD